jgi:hypothetical protein
MCILRRYALAVENKDFSPAPGEMDIDPESLATTVPEEGEASPTEVRDFPFRVESPELAERIARSTQDIHGVAASLRERGLQELNHLEIDPDQAAKAGWRPENWEQMHPVNQEEFLRATRDLRRSEYNDALADIHERGMSFNAQRLEEARQKGWDTAHWEQSLTVSEFEAKIDGALAKLRQRPLGEVAEQLGLHFGSAIGSLHALRPRGPKPTKTPGINLNRL